MGASEVLSGWALARCARGEDRESGVNISNLQLEMLLARYRKETKNKRFSAYRRDLARETVAALVELQRRRKLEAIPVKGSVR